MNKSFVYESGAPAKYVEASQGKAGAILGKLEAPFFDLSNPTRNGRFYGEAVEDALNSDEFKEKIETRTFFGRLGHPMTEDEANEDPAVRAAVILTDYKKNPSTNMYEGTLEILNNQYGKQLKSLIDAGCVMGVSTRGSGDSYESGGNEIITKGSYEFEALDVVTLPAVKAARVRVLESVDKSKRVSLESLIESSNDKHVLEALRVTVESSEMPNKKTLIESIDKKLSSGVETIESLANDIAELSTRLTESEKKRAELEESNRKLQESQKSAGTTEKIVENVSNSNDKKLLGLLRSGGQVIESMKSELIERDKKIKSLEKRVQKSESLVKRLEESRRTVRTENRELSQKYSSLLESSKKEVESKSKSFNENLSSVNKKVHSLEESLASSKLKIKSLSESLKKRDDKIRQLESANKSMAESMVSLKSKYLESIAVAMGISLEALKSKVTRDSTASQIEAAAKSIRESDDARRALPDLSKLGKVVQESQITQVQDPELARAARVAKLTSSQKN